MVQPALQQGVHYQFMYENYGYVYILEHTKTFVSSLRKESWMWYLQQEGRALVWKDWEHWERAGRQELRLSTHTQGGTSHQ